MRLLKRLKNLWEISKFHPETYGRDDSIASLISEGYKGKKDKDGSLAVTNINGVEKPPHMAEIIKRTNPAKEFIKNE